MMKEHHSEGLGEMNDLRDMPSGDSWPTFGGLQIQYWRRVMPTQWFPRGQGQPTAPGCALQKTCVCSTPHQRIPTFEGLNLLAGLSLCDESGHV